MHFATCTALAAVLFTTLNQNLRLCSSAEAGIVLKFRPKNEQKKSSYKIVLIKKSVNFLPVG